MNAIEILAIACAVLVSLILIMQSVEVIKRSDKRKPYNFADSYHGMANSMPKQLRLYFESIDVRFEDDEMVDIIIHSSIELVNRWKKKN